MGCKQSTAKRFSEPAGGQQVIDVTDQHHSTGAHHSRPHTTTQPQTKPGQQQPGRHHVDPHHDNSDTPKAKSQYKGLGPTQQGDISACFRDGLLYRIVQPKAWYFYNDTQEYEMHVSFTFGATSELSAVPPAKLQRSVGEDSSIIVSVVIYPGETTPFIEGEYNGYKSNIAARPLSAEYRNRVNAAANKQVQQELDVINKLCRNSKDIQRILESCVRQGIPFVDVAFPPLQASLSRPEVDSRAIAETAWKRPRNFLPPGAQATLFANGVDPNDIDQGQLGDCWLLCSIAALAEFPEKVADMFAHPVSDQESANEQRVGAYRVTLNKHGWWHVILVDDYLPVVGSKPCFAKCVEDPGELWVSLLEKAYAKLHGSYAAITGGDALLALQDLTGYPVFRLDETFTASLKDRAVQLELFKKLEAYDQQNFLININTPGHDTSAYMGSGKQGNAADMEARFKKAGLALGHAYTVLEVRSFPDLDLRLLKIRNPWGNGVEWTGRWGDHDISWQQHPDVARALHFTASDDGTFWMCWEDVLKYFDGGGVCFTRFDWYDYRARGRFENGYPNLIFEISVDEPVEAYAILSQKDKRGLPSSDPEAKYSALMLSVSRTEGHDPSHQRIHLNSSANTEEPSEEFAFNYDRDLGMKYTFLPQESPYYIIPRIYDAGGNRDYVMGLIAEKPATRSKFRVNFKSFPKTCMLFQDYPSFVVENASMVTTDYQKYMDVGSPISKQGTCIE